ncbi:MFS transporter [Candidatus Poriferisocius sp.]|uniref:MFS transporter n=1 Tax=Candidatus Poriferisocius sp. TaxID=3101276 RepID=UPI003B59537A
MINTSFLRLVRVHALGAAGDAMITIALAGSLFFSIDPSAARLRVTLYLVLTMAPFAVVGPFIGPALDRFRGGRRPMIFAINAGRAFVALLMISNMDSLLLFPLAFMMLVLQKSYGVAKASMVPIILHNEEQFVGGNARLALVGGVCGFLGAGPALLANVLGGASWAVALAMVVFLLCAVASLSLPPGRMVPQPAGDEDESALRTFGIRRAASATGTLRGIVGFMTFLAAFALRGGADDVNLSGVGKAFGAGVRHALQGDVASDASPAWKLGLVAAATVAGFLVGSLLAPKLRDRLREEFIITAALVALALVGVLAAWGGGFGSTLLLALGVGVTASAGKLSFDSIVQRDAEGANHGRAFAAFETRFQIFWVLGALIPVIIPIPARVGFLLIGLAAGVAAVYFWVRRTASPVDRSGPATDPEHQPQRG